MLPKKTESKSKRRKTRIGKSLDEIKTLPDPDGSEATVEAEER